MLILLALMGCQPEAEDSGKPTGDDTAEDTAIDTADTWPEPEDADLDGVTPADGDCDDTNAEIRPGRGEDCNGIDDNCVNGVDEGWLDGDGDGTADCLDAEECDGVDNDGDGSVDEDSLDSDQDGRADCVDAEECDGLDNNGDGAVDEGFDADSDGFASCDECDDTDGTVYPGAPEPDDGLDNDCDGLVDDEGWAVGALVLTEVMANPQDYADDEGEWIEVYNASARDLDLNGLTLASGAESHVIDAGGALLLAPGEHLVLGAGAQAWVDYTWDDLALLNESDEITISADTLELDALSWDDGRTMPDTAGASVMVDPWYVDAEANDDTSAWCAATVPWDEFDAGSPGSANEPCFTIDHDFDGFAGSAGDCDDADDTIAPGLADTWYDGEDTDCDGWSDFDADRDGHDALAYGGGDCDDVEPTANPDATEVCDDANVDEDCSGLADDEDGAATGKSTWYADADDDGYGDASVDQDACDQPAGYVTTDDDCDDASDTVSPGATDVCGNGVDDDCDGGPSGCGPSGDFSADDADAILLGEAMGDAAATSLSFAGDLDGDGASDLLVGVYQADGSGADSGIAYVFKGLPSGQSSLGDADARLMGAAAGDYAGYSVAGAGDVDGDGTNDLIVGALYYDGGASNGGGAFVVSGVASGDFDLSGSTVLLLGEDRDDAAGTGVQGFGDVDGDGFADVGLGASSDDDGGAGAGAYYLVAGGTTGSIDLSAATAKLVGEDASDAAGVYTAAGDVDGDGISDLLVGACADDTGGMDGGAVYVVYLPVTGTLDLSAADAKIYSEGGQDSACHPSVLGDVDGDGLVDIAVGAPEARDGRTRPGAAYLVDETPSGSVDLATAAARIVGESDGDMLGFALGGGDVNGDGFADLVVSAYINAADGPDSGAVYLFSGPIGAGDISATTADATIAGGGMDRFGTALTSGGDADADGFADILSAAPQDGTSATRAGAVYMILGGTGY